MRYGQEFCSVCGRGQQVKQEKKQTIPEIIEEVKCEICDNYCKYPLEYQDNEILEVICNRCPLNKLEVKE